MKPGDVVTTVDGEQVTSSTDLRNRIGLARAGATAALTVIRDGRMMELRATLAGR